MRFFSFKSFKLLHRTSKTESECTAVEAVPTAAIAVHVASRPMSADEPVLIGDSVVPIPSSPSPSVSTITPTPEQAHIASLQSLIASLKSTNATYTSEYAFLHAETASMRTAYTLASQRFEREAHEAEAVHKKKADTEMKLLAYESFIGLLVEVGLHEKTQWMNEEDADEGFVDAIKTCVETNPRSGWATRILPRVINSEPTPEYYTSAINATLAARKELRETKEVAEYWKTRALFPPQSNEQVAVITPSPSDLPSLPKKDLTPERQNAVDELLKKRNGGELPAWRKAQLESQDFSSNAAAPSESESTSTVRPLNYTPHFSRPASFTSLNQEEDAEEEEEEGCSDDDSIFSNNGSSSYSLNSLFPLPPTFSNVSISSIPQTLAYDDNDGEEPSVFDYERDAEEYGYEILRTEQHAATYLEDIPEEDEPEEEEAAPYTMIDDDDDEEEEEEASDELSWGAEMTTTSDTSTVPTSVDASPASSPSKNASPTSSSSNDIPPAPKAGLSKSPLNIFKKKGPTEQQPKSNIPSKLKRFALLRASIVNNNCNSDDSPAMSQPAPSKIPSPSKSSRSSPSPSPASPSKSKTSRLPRLNINVASSGKKAIQRFSQILA